MKHPDRVFGVFRERHVNLLAENIFCHQWCRCVGFEFGQYLFLNDSVSDDSLIEFAVFKSTERGYVQIETISILLISHYEVDLDLALFSAMGSKANYGTYDFQLEDAEKHACDLCE
jgi:hypothetical protein